MIEIAYWKMRCLVGGIRVLLEHAGAGKSFFRFLIILSFQFRPYCLGYTIKLITDWKETHYESHMNPDGTWDRSEWLDVKNQPHIQRNFDFPNIPWMKDGDVYLTQSTAILKV